MTILSKGLSRSEVAGSLLGSVQSIWRNDLVPTDKCRSSTNRICLERPFKFHSVNGSWALHCFAHKNMASQKAAAMFDFSVLAQDPGKRYLLPS